MYMYVPDGHLNTFKHHSVSFFVPQETLEYHASTVSNKDTSGLLEAALVSFLPSCAPIHISSAYNKHTNTSI